MYANNLYKRNKYKNLDLSSATIAFPQKDNWQQIDEFSQVYGISWSSALTNTLS